MESSVILTDGEMLHSEHYHQVPPSHPDFYTIQIPKMKRETIKHQNRRHLTCPPLMQMVMKETNPKRK